MRRLRFLTIIGLVLGLSAGVAYAGSLTAFEYQQLVVARDKLKTAKSTSAALWDCEQIQMQSRLLSEERADCISGIKLATYNGQMRSYVRDCAAYGSVAQRLRCLLPAYEQFGRIFATYYGAESVIHRIAIERGLGEDCADLLSDSPVVISEERSAVAAIGSIIAAAKAGDLAKFEAESRAVVALSAAIGRGQQANSGPTSICPHPGGHSGTTGKPTI